MMDMNIRIKSIVAGLLTAALVFFLYHKIFRSNKQELFKAHFLLKISNDKQGDVTNGKEITGEIPSIINRRIRNLGYIPVIRISGNNQLDITIEKIRDTSFLRLAIIQNNKIEFREVYTLDELPSFFEIADNTTAKIFPSETGEEKSIYTFLSPMAPGEGSGKTKFPAAIGAVNKNDTAILRRIISEPVLLQKLPGDVEFYYGKLTDENRIRNTPDDLRLYAIRTKGEKALIQNNDIENAAMSYDNYSGEPAIFIRFNNAGKRKWEIMTSDNAGRYIAIILDGIVVTAPLVINPIHSTEVTLNGRFAEEEARKLADQLKMGLLPANLSIIKAEINSENNRKPVMRWIISIIVFAVTTALAFLVFNTLKNS